LRNAQVVRTAGARSDRATRPNALAGSLSNLSTQYAVQMESTIHLPFEGETHAHYFGGRF
jgi:hypothetical protein